MRTRGGARPGGDAHAPFYAGGTASRFSGSHAQAFCRRSNGNILRHVRGQRRTTKCTVGRGRSGLGLGEKLTQKREAPAVVVRGSRAEASPRFWQIVMLERNAACALPATAANAKTIRCDISDKSGRLFSVRPFEFRRGPFRISQGPVFGI